MYHQFMCWKNKLQNEAGNDNTQFVALAGTVIAKIFENPLVTDIEGM